MRQVECREAIWCSQTQFSLSMSEKHQCGNCVSKIKNRAAIRNSCEITLSNIKVTDLDFTDDMTLTSEILETLVAALNAFTNKAKPLGLEISYVKAKSQGLGVKNLLSR